MRQVRPWTDAEDDLVRSGEWEIPGRTRQAVRLRRMKLGVSQKRSSSWTKAAWTSEEDQAIREGALALQGRTPAAVKVRRLSLGVVLQQREPGRPWTDDEVRTLIAEWESCSYSEMGERLGRTRSAVSQKVRDLGLGHPPDGQRRWAPLGEAAAAWKGGSLSSGNYGRAWQRGPRLEVLSRDGWTCVACSSTSNLVVHHIDPYIETQDHSVGNQVTLCATCHGWIELMLPREIMKHALRVRDFGEVQRIVAIDRAA